MRHFSPLSHPKALMAITMGAFLLLFTQSRIASAPAQVLTLEGFTMGTTWEVQVATQGRPGPDPALGQAIIAGLDRLDKAVFSTYVAESELSRLNATTVGEALSVSRDLQEVLLLARTINRQSFGAFDVTVGPLVNLWGFGPTPAQRVPEPAAIDAARARLGADQYLIDIRAGTVQRTADIELDLSAIAKGYAVDRIAELLNARGFNNFLIEIGGEVRVQGVKEPGQPWTLALETPQLGDPAPFARIRTFGQSFALAGSGDYRNYFEQDGKRYSHEISPRTGYPADHALAAVTILADTAAEADAWATAMMVLGPSEGPLLAERRQMAAYFIIRSNDGWESRYTPAFEPYLNTQGRE
jgi:thiamine biosynthesis lipoprotein